MFKIFSLFLIVLVLCLIQGILVTFIIRSIGNVVEVMSLISNTMFANDSARESENTSNAKNDLGITNPENDITSEIDLQAEFDYLTQSLILFSVLRWAVKFLRKFLQRKLNAEVDLKLHIEGFESEFMQKPDVDSQYLNEFETEMYGGYHGKIVQVISAIFPQFLVYFTAISGNLIQSLIIQPRLTVLLLASLISCTSIIFIVLKKASSFYASRYSRARWTVKLLIDEMDYHADTILGFGYLKKARNIVEKKLNRIKGLRLISSYKISLALGSIFFTLYCASALAFWVGSQLILSQNTTVGRITVVVLAIFVSFIEAKSAFPLLKKILNCRLRLLLHKLGIYRIRKEYPGAALYQYKKDFVKNIHWRHKQISPDRIMSIKPKIGFENLNFCLEDQQILSDAVLQVCEKSITVFVGENSSIVLDLIARFRTLSHSTTHGMITIGNLDIQSIPIALYRQVVGYVESTPRLFNQRTLLENLYLNLKVESLIDCSKKEFLERRYSTSNLNAVNLVSVMNVCEMLRLMPLVSAPGSLKNCSVSNLDLLDQKKLCIARAILRNPLVLLIENPFHGLPIHEQYELADVLVELTQNYTIILCTDVLPPGIVFKDMFCLKNGKFVHYEPSGIEHLDITIALDSDTLPVGIVSSELLKKPNLPENANSDSEIMYNDMQKDTETRKSWCSWNLSKLHNLMKQIFGALKIVKVSKLAIILTISGSIMCGLVTSGFTIVFAKILDACALYEDKDVLRQRASFWCAMLFAFAVGGWLSYFIQNFFSNFIANSLDKSMKILMIDYSFSQVDQGCFGLTRLRQLLEPGSLSENIIQYGEFWEIIMVQYFSTFIQLIACYIGSLSISIFYGWKLSFIALSLMPIATILWVLNHKYQKRLRDLTEMRRKIIFEERLECLKASKTIHATSSASFFAQSYKSTLNTINSEILQKSWVPLFVDSLASSYPLFSLLILLYVGYQFIINWEAYNFFKTLVVLLAISCSWYCLKIMISLLISLLDFSKSFNGFSKFLEIFEESKKQSQFKVMHCSMKTTDAFYIGEAQVSSSSYRNSYFLDSWRYAPPSVSSMFREHFPTILGHNSNTYSEAIGVESISFCSLNLLVDWNLEILPGEHLFLVDNCQLSQLFLHHLLALEQSSSGHLNFTKYAGGKKTQMQVKTLDPTITRSKISWVHFDEWYMEGDTIADVIAFGYEKRWEEIVSVSQLVGIHVKILGLKDGYDTIVNEQITADINLWKGICITRAFIRDPQIVLFDQMFDLTDKADLELMSSLFQLSRYTTLIMCVQLESFQDIKTIWQSALQQEYFWEDISLYEHPNDIDPSINATIPTLSSEHKSQFQSTPNSFFRESSKAQVNQPIVKIVQNNGRLSEFI